MPCARRKHSIYQHSEMSLCHTQKKERKVKEKVTHEGKKKYNFSLGKKHNLFEHKVNMAAV